MRCDRLCRAAVHGQIVGLHRLHQYRWRHHVQGVRRPRRGARAASGPACTLPCPGREDRREVGHAASYIASCLREMTMHQTMIGTKIRRCLKANTLSALCVAQLPAASFAASDQVLLPRNLSPWGMFVNADIVVKAVMIGLAFASLVTWTIWLAKTIELRRKTTTATRGLSLLERDTALADAERESRDGGGAVAQIIRSAAREANLSGGTFDDGFKERIALRLDRVEAAMSRQIARGTGVLVDDRRHRTVCRLVRNGVGHHERLHRHFRSAHHKPGGGRAGHRRSPARNRAGPGGGDPRGGDLQSSDAIDRGLSRAARRRLRAGAASDQPRRRSPRFSNRAGGGVSDGYETGRRGCWDDQAVARRR